MTMHKYTEGNVSFNFPNDLKVIKYDADRNNGDEENGFYRRQSFYKFAGGSKAVDYIVLDPSKDGALWLIEVKDCMWSSKETVSEYIKDNIPVKIRDTFAGLLAGALTSTSEAERAYMNEALKKRPVRVVAHIELPDLTRVSKIAKNQKSLLKDYFDMAVKSISPSVGRENVIIDNSSICHKDVPWKTNLKQRLISSGVRNC